MVRAFLDELAALHPWLPDILSAIVVVLTACVDVSRRVQAALIPLGCINAVEESLGCSYRVR